VIPLRDINPIRTRPVVTYLLIAANTAVFLYQAQLSQAAGQLFAHQWGLVPYYLTQPEHIAFGSFETPFTSMFMHGGWLHLISNMWFLHIFGDNVEDTLGHVRFLLFYVACGLAAAVAQVVIDPSSTVPMIGASGAIAGVLGAYFMLFPHARVVTLIPVFVLFFVRELPAVFFIVIWFGMQLLSGIGSLGIDQQTGGVAFFAHIGGFLGGLWLLRAFGFSRNRTRGFRRGESGYPRVDPYQRWKD
jgi:membrane associated rhomboid family serine protease